MNARDIMTKDVFTVAPELEIHKLAEFFVAKNISGVPVVSASGEVQGVVLEDDLIVRDRKVHLPTFVFLLSGVITFGEKKLEEEMKKISARTAGEVMRKKFAVISPQTPVEDIAGMVVDESQNYFLVMDNKRLEGIVTKKDIVRAISENKLF